MQNFPGQLAMQSCNNRVETRLPCKYFCLKKLNCGMYANIFNNSYENISLQVKG